MKTSIAASPILPLVTGIGALVLILGTLQNAPIEEDTSLASANAAADAAAGAATNAVPDGVDLPSDTGVPADAAAAAGTTLGVGKAGTVGGLKLTVSEVTAAGADVTVAKKTYTLEKGTPATIGKYTVTVTKVNVKGKKATVSVEG